MTGARRAARLVAWANAVLVGAVSPDLAAERVVADGPPHRVPSGADGEVSMPVLLARLAAAGGPPASRLLLPVAGDPVGLPGPGPLATAGLDAGAVALLAGPGGLRALVPPAGSDGSDDVVRWHGYDVDARHRDMLASLPSLAESERALAVAVREATEVLTALDVAPWDDASAEQVAALRDGRFDGDLLAPGYPSRATALLVRARRLRSVVALARSGAGGAVTAGEMAGRVGALAPLDRAARLAEMAAYNVLAEPVGARRW